MTTRVPFTKLRASIFANKIVKSNILTIIIICMHFLKLQTVQTPLLLDSVKLLKQIAKHNKIHNNKKTIFETSNEGLIQ